MYIIIFFLIECLLLHCNKFQVFIISKRNHKINLHWLITQIWQWSTHDPSCRFEVLPVTMLVCFALSTLLMETEHTCGYAHLSKCTSSWISTHRISNHPSTGESGGFFPMGFPSWIAIIFWPNFSYSVFYFWCSSLWLSLVLSQYCWVGHDVNVSIPIDSAFSIALCGYVTVLFGLLGIPVRATF